LADALAAAADQFKETAPGTRHIVIVTDGVDTPGGKVTMANALKQLNSNSGQRARAELHRHGTT
jgi:hypothetical protein